MKTSSFEDIEDGARFDVLVVGSGFGGSVAALRFAEKGYGVAVLEAGRNYEDGDFPRTNWNLRRYLWAPRLLLYGIQRLTLLGDALILSGAGVGGGSLVYANTLLEPGDAFYSLEPVRRLGADLRARLRPHFETARRMLGVTQVPELYPADAALKEVAVSIGRGDTFKKADVGVYFGEPGKEAEDPFFGGEGPRRSGCTRCGGCMIGCRHNAKNTLVKNYLYLAAKKGARVYEMSTAASIEEAPDGGFFVSVRRSGWGRRRRRVFAKRLVLAAGVLGTVRLLLEPSNKLSRLPSRVGRDVRTNSEVLLGSSAFGSDADYSQGVAIGSGMWADESTHVEAVRYPAGSDAMSFLGVREAGGSSLAGKLARLAWRAVSRPLETLSLWLPFGWARRTTILLCMQPSESRFRLKTGLRSEPEPGSPPPPAGLPAASEVLRRFAERTGGVAQGSLASMFGLSTTAHILGGAALGTGPENGVTGLDGKVFGYDDLWVLDGSALPANLGVNPSLTITALAEHAMSQVLEASKTDARALA
jgi:cholesterol oxidase